MAVTLHTNHGDMKLEIFCDSVPRTAFNFLALAASGYYDGTLFHRNVKGFMLQGGDPTGTGKGGESIWGGKFSDELRSENTHAARGTLSMANSGPNTNGSQFFMTYAKHPHLDNNYTVFGKGTRQCIYLCVWCCLALPEHTLSHASHGARVHSHRWMGRSCSY